MGGKRFLIIGRGVFGIDLFLSFFFSFFSFFSILLFCIYPRFSIHSF